MKTWSLAEIESLMNTVEELGPSAGFRKHIEQYPIRSFQGCSHMYYRTKTLRALEQNRVTQANRTIVTEAAGTPADATKHCETKDCSTKISGIRKFRVWLSKLFK